jgi:hypothetical protein
MAAPFVSIVSAPQRFQAPCEQMKQFWDLPEKPLKRALTRP